MIVREESENCVGCLKLERARGGGVRCSSKMKPRVYKPPVVKSATLIEPPGWCHGQFRMVVKQVESARGAPA